MNKDPSGPERCRYLKEQTSMKHTGTTNGHENTPKQREGGQEKTCRKIREKSRAGQSVHRKGKGKRPERVEQPLRKNERRESGPEHMPQTFFKL